MVIRVKGRWSARVEQEFEIEVETEDEIEAAVADEAAPGRVVELLDIEIAVESTEVGEAVVANAQVIVTPESAWIRPREPGAPISISNNLLEARGVSLCIGDGPTVPAPPERPEGGLWGYQDGDGEIEWGEQHDLSSFLAPRRGWLGSLLDRLGRS